MSKSGIMLEGRYKHLYSQSATMNPRSETVWGSPYNMTAKSRKEREHYISAQLRHIKTLPMLAALETQIKREMQDQYNARQDTLDQRTRHSARLELKQRYLLLQSIQTIAPMFIEQALDEQRYLNLPEHERVDIRRYRYLCSFKLQPADLCNVKGYHLLVKHGWYNHKTNPGGVVKDHRFSIKMGWQLKVDPEIMSHPINCEFLLNADNIRKSDSCSVTLQSLQKEIGE